MRLIAAIVITVAVFGFVGWCFWDESRRSGGRW